MKRCTCFLVQNLPRGSMGIFMVPASRPIFLSAGQSASVSVSRISDTIANPYGQNVNLHLHSCHCVCTQTCILEVGKGARTVGLLRRQSLIIGLWACRPAIFSTHTHPHYPSLPQLITNSQFPRSFVMRAAQSKYASLLEMVSSQHTNV